MRDLQFNQTWRPTLSLEEVMLNISHQRNLFLMWKSCQLLKAQAEAKVVVEGEVVVKVKVNVEEGMDVMTYLLEPKKNTVWREMITLDPSTGWRHQRTFLS